MFGLASGNDDQIRVFASLDIFHPQPIGKIVIVAA
jgi:hypothetical protein